MVPSLKNKPSKQQALVCLLGLLFDLEDGGITFLRSFGKLLPDYTVSHPRR
jgi:hypothetical protein